MLLASEEHSLFETGPLDLYSLSQPSPSSQTKYFVSENENILGQFPPVKHIKTGYSYYTPTFAFHILTWARNWQREQGEEKNLLSSENSILEFFFCKFSQKKKNSKQQQNKQTNSKKTQQNNQTTKNPNQKPTAKPQKPKNHHQKSTPTREFLQKISIHFIFNSSL